MTPPSKWLSWRIKNYLIEDFWCSHLLFSGNYSSDNAPRNQTFDSKLKSQTVLKLFATSRIKKSVIGFSYQFLIYEFVRKKIYSRRDTQPNEKKIVFRKMYFFFQNWLFALFDISLSRFFLHKRRPLCALFFVD